jgi:membrane fusion protein, multidrug efflux system
METVRRFISHYRRLRSMRPTRKKRLAASAVAISMLVAGCGQRPQEAASASGPPPVPVRVEPAVQRAFQVQIHAGGTVEPSSTVIVKASVGGVLQSVHFDEGEMVRAGQLLFAIDARTQHELIRQLEANLAKNAVQARNAQTEAARYAELYKLGIVARQQYESYEASAAGWRATLEADREAIETARQQLNQANVHSPLSGRTGSLMTQPGSQVTANETALVTIHQIQPIYVSFSVAEKELPEIQARFASGLHVEATAAGGRSAHGKLTFVDNAVDPSRGTIRLKATFANSDRRLWPGQFANVILTLAEELDAVVIPYNAVQHDRETPFLFVVGESGIAERRNIEVRRRAGDSSSVTGVLPGERVVTEGHAKLTPGSPVQIVQ